MRRNKQTDSLDVEDNDDDDLQQDPKDPGGWVVSRLMFVANEKDSHGDNQ